MRTIDLKDILKTVEQVRSESYPDLDATFIEAVVRAEEQNPDSDDAALRAIHAALKATLTKAGT